VSKTPQEIGDKITASIDIYSALVQQILAALSVAGPALKGSLEGLFDQLKQDDLLTSDQAVALLARLESRDQAIANA